MMVFKIVCYSWDDNEQITPRYTAVEIESAIESEKKYIIELETEIRELEQKIKEAGN